MYESSFGLTEAPFSISPDPRYLYMSRRHQEAMAHLRYGIQESGGFVQLTGEVGTGKTTICRCMLEQLPENVDVALILNPQISHSELLATLCDEIGVSYPAEASPKRLLDLLNERLIENFARGRRTVLVIDEAQMLTREVLEEIRILTNLETTKQKLLQIILIGQPELSETLSRRDLRQLAQRITARYHLEPLMREETAEYVKYRLGIAGCHRSVFSGGALRRVFKVSHGVPRLINVICDRALLGAYSSDSDRVTGTMVSQAAKEVFGGTRARSRVWWWVSGLAVVSVAAVATLRFQWWTVTPPSVTLPASRPAAPANRSSKAETSTAVPSALAYAATEAPAKQGSGKASPADAPEDPPAAPLALAPASTGAGASDNSPASLPEVLTSTDAPRTEGEALAGLLKAWRIDFDDAGGLSCARVEQVFGLRCLKEQGSWKDLESFNRVAALRFEQGDQVSYLLLTGLGPDRAVFSGDKGVYAFTRAQVDPYWHGRYVLLWRAPPHGARNIAENSDGVDVLWLRQTLARLPDVQIGEVDNARFDSSLKRKVMAFQESNNLRVDGVAGLHTIIRLNGIVDPSVPKLESAAG
ncbi:MAG: AAA family ATPase [Arenicellales bacterium]